MKKPSPGVIKQIISEEMSRRSLQRMKTTTKAQRKKVAASGGKAAWKGLSAEERSAMMRERAAKQWATKRAKQRPKG
jgi:hypothetical protein